MSYHRSLLRRMATGLLALGLGTVPTAFIAEALHPESTFAQVVPRSDVAPAPVLPFDASNASTTTLSGTYVSTPACWSPEDCVAVGSSTFEDSHGNKTMPGALVIFHDGKAGPPVQVGPGSGPGFLSLSSVGCGGSGDCVATGYTFVNDNGTLTEDLVILKITNGSPGQPQTVDDPPLYGVTCPTPDDCLAVGIVSSGPTDTGVVYAINPHTLALTSLGGIPSAGAIGCTGIQADGQPLCIIGATSGGTGSTDDNELVVFDGDHFVADVPAPESSRRFEGADIRGVSCPTLSSCVATAGGDGSEGGYFPISISEAAAKSGSKRGDVSIKVRAGALRAVSGTTGLGSAACGADSGCVLGGWAGSGSSVAGELTPLDPKSGKLGKPTSLAGFGEAFGIVLPPGLTVNTTKDQAGSEASCQAGGVCTLGAAFDAINAGAIGDAFVVGQVIGGTPVYVTPETATSINFDIPWLAGTPVINLAKPLPTLKNPVTLDGATQPGTGDGKPGVRIDGAGAGSSANGIELDGKGSVLNGLAVTGFGGDGILLKGANASVTDSWIGVAAKSGGGYQAVPNGDGIEVAGSNDIIGGPSAGSRDVISGNGHPSALKNVMASFSGKHVAPSELRSDLVPQGAGILVRESPVSGLQIKGNYIGLAPDGTELPAGDGNAVGIGILSTGSVSNVAIGANPGGNVITGNTVGIMAAAPSYNALSGLSIEGNLIGALPDDTAGTDSMGNLLGVMAINVAGLVVGSPGGGTGNTISGDGVGLVISGSKKPMVQSDAFGVDAPFVKGIKFDDRSFEVGLHDIIGAALIDSTGATFGGGGSGGGDIATSDCGVAGAACLVSGGETAAELEGRVASVVGGQASGTNGFAGNDGLGNRLLGDGIGLMVTGDGKAGSGSDTIEGNVFGRAKDSGHPISFEDSHGLEDLGGVFGLVVSGSDGNIVADNSFLGTVGGVWAHNSSSSIYESNIFSSDILGLMAIGDPQSQIGGTGGNGDQNGNIFVRDGFGLLLADSNPGRFEVRAAGLQNGDTQSTQFDAPLASPAIEDDIATAGAIAGEPIDAAILSPKPAPGTGYVVDDNGFGIDGSGTGGLGDVVGSIILGDVTHAQFAGNAVWNNQKGGLWIVQASGKTNSVAAYGDSIYNNSVASPKAKDALGIDLWTANEKGEELGPDLPSTKQPGIGANHLQNAPDITQAKVSNGVFSISGKLQSAPNTNYAIDLYASETCNPSGSGEGQLLIGQTAMKTGSGGGGSFAMTTKAIKASRRDPRTGDIIVVGHIVTATASDVLNKGTAHSRPDNILIKSNLDATSEFSSCATAHS